MVGRLIAAVALLVVLAAMALGGEVTVNSDGYVRSGAFFFRDGSSTPYTRESNWAWVAPVWVAPANCYQCGYWRAGYWVWQSYSYTAVSVDPNRSDARQLLLQMAKDAKAADNFRLARAQEHRETLELATALGLQGVLTPSFTGYGTGSLQLSTAGVQGGTVYGYQSYQQTTQTYGNPIDTTALLQQTLRLTEQVGSNARQAHSEAIDLTKVVTQGQERIAEIYAKGQTAAAVLQGLKPDPSTKTTTTITTPVVPTQVGPATAAPAGVVSNAVVSDFHKLSGPLKCVACHGGDKPKGGFSITLYDPETVSAEDQQRVLNYLNSPDPDHHCPPGANRLTAEELGQFIGKWKPKAVAPAPAPEKMPAAKE